MGCGVIHMVSSSIVMVLLLLIGGGSGRPSTKMTDSGVKNICLASANTELCVQALSSDPRTAAADLKGLAQISIDLAKANATDTATFIASLLGKAIDNRQLKVGYKACATYFNSCIGSLDDCTEAVSSGDYYAWHSQASASLEGPVSCGSSFQGPPADPAHLSGKCQIMEILINIILIIAKRLTV